MQPPDPWFALGCSILGHELWFSEQYNTVTQSIYRTKSAFNKIQDNAQ